MNTLKFIELFRELPVRGAGCCVDLRPSRLTENEAKEQSRLFAALADPTRLGILALLAAQPAPLCVCEISAAFPLGQATISHHLKLLRDAELVLWEKRGLWVYYAPNPERLSQVAALVEALRPKVTAK
jgi:ArsR family transcriptional regulator